MKWRTAVLSVLLACSSNGNGGNQNSATSLTGSSPTSGSTGSATNSTDNPPNDDNGPGTGPGDSGDETPTQTRFDVGGGNEFCETRDAGTYCDDQTAVVCDGNGGTTSTTNCIPGICVDGEGCVVCSDGQFACHGPRVMGCDTSGADPTWTEVELCDPAMGEVCDVSFGSCIPLAPIGTTEPTGEYYQYALFDLTGTGFSQVSDVDTYEDRIYFVAMYMGALTIGMYDVTLLDSDGDGLLEPNQHPDYPDEQGPIEERVFELVGSFPLDNPGAFPNIMELYATATSVVFTGPNNVGSYDLATGTITQIAPMPTWIGSTSYSWLAFLGYDEINDVWYSGNESARRVFQYDSASGTWGYAFEFPVLAGDHMDAMEVVVDPNTGTPFVYVSDMTSNFIGQYRHDPDLGWVQENLFSYVETTGALVEGFGYGALNHFWVGSLGFTFYELGGGGLVEFTEPEG